MSARRRVVAGIAALTVLAVGVRLAAAANAAVIVRDGVAYLDAASRWDGGALRAAVGHQYPPLFPLLIVGAARVSGLGVGEAAGLLAAALAGALVVPAVAASAWRIAGPRAALGGALLAAVHPIGVELGGDVLADGPFLALLAAAMALGLAMLDGRRAAAPAAGLAAALAYLARPEGIVALGALVVAALLAPRSARWPRRVGDAALVLSPAALAVVPFVLAIKDHAALGGAGAGAIKLTLKRDLSSLLLALEPAAALGRLVHQSRHALVALGPAAAALLLALLARRDAREAGSREPARRMLALAGLTGAGLLAAFVIVRVDLRYGAQLATLALPFAGAGALVAARALSRRGVSSRAALALVAALVAATSLPFALRPRREDKRVYVEAGRVLRAAGARRVLARDARAAHYAGAAAVHLLQELGPDDRDDPDALARIAQATDADGLVVVAREVRPGLAARLGVEPRRVADPEDAGATLEVYLLAR